VTTNDPVLIERLPRDELDCLEPLWHDLLDHIVDAGSVVPIRPATESWPMRRAVYDEILETPESFALVARRNGEPVGYAMVKVLSADAVWYTGDLHAELESLSLLPSERGAGVGSRLMDTIDAELERLGVTDLIIGVDSVNEGALRFYQKRGFKIGFHLMYGRPGGGSWAADERARERPYSSRSRPAGQAPEDPSNTRRP
jgi:ribosomal protein S18 acetylase RimI-like enzyme